MFLILIGVLIVSIWFPHQAAQILSTSEHLFEAEENPTFNFAKQKKTRPYLSPYRSKIIAAKQNFKCNVCKKQFSDDLWDIDHIIPIFLGGSNSDNNLQALCKKCHQSKSVMERRKK